MQQVRGKLTLAEITPIAEHQYTLRAVYTNSYGFTTKNIEAGMYMFCYAYDKKNYPEIECFLITKVWGYVGTIITFDVENTHDLTPTLDHNEAIIATKTSETGFMILPTVNDNIPKSLIDDARNLDLMDRDFKFATNIERSIRIEMADQNEIDQTQTNDINTLRESLLRQQETSWKFDYADESDFDAESIDLQNYEILMTEAKDNF